MKYSFEITREDYADFCKFDFIKNRLYRTIATCILVILYIQYFLNRNEFNLIATVISTTICLFICFFLYYVSLSNTGRIPMDDGAILGTRHFEFNEMEITCKTKDSRSAFDWTSIKKLVIGKTALYLYFDTNMAILFPKRIFANEKEQAEFEKLILDKIKTN